MYKVKEIFYSLCGEGAHAGRPAVFARFAGCNLWNGLESGRATALCRFCDTDFHGGETYETPLGLSSAILAAWPSGETAPYVVLTGGEPALQVDWLLVAYLKGMGARVAIETNGTRPLPAGIDWVTVSPKAGTTLAVTSGDELKFVFPQPGAEPERYEGLDFHRFYLQAMDGPDRAANEAAVAKYCLDHPRWRMSFQLHKHLGLR